MKLYHIKDVNKFFEVIDSCEGKVELVGEDMRINLKSKFSQYFSIAEIFAGEEIDELEIIAYNQNDVTKLINFMMDGNE